MQKIAILCFCISGLFTAAHAVLLDDFQGYGTGTVREMASPPWIAIGDTGYAEIMTGSEGGYITWGWATAPRGAALTLADVQASPIAKSSTAATVYFRIYAASEAVNHSFGLSDLSGGFSSFTDYEAQVIVSDNGISDGLVTVSVRNGGTAPVVGVLRVGHWYNVWLVINNSVNRYDMYLTGGTTAASESNRAAHNFSFRNGTTGALTSIFLWCQNQPQTLRIGRITLSDGVNLMIPRDAQQAANGHFEDGEIGSLTDGVPGWRHWGGSTGRHHNDAGACRGTKGMKLGWNSSGLWQDFAAAAGTTCLYSVDAMDWSGDTSANNWNFQIEAEFYNSAHVQLSAAVLGVFDSSAEPDDTWVRIGGAVTAPAGTAYGRVVLRLTGWKNGIGGAIYFDNVSVISQNVRNADYNKDFHVDFMDYSHISDFWQKAAPQYDLNGDDILTTDDLTVFARHWLSRQVPFGTETIAIHPSVTYQEIEGFGASLTDSSAWLIYRFLSVSERQAVLTDLFDPDKGIGLSYLRQPMGASDFRLNDYSYNDLPDGAASDHTLSHFSIAYDEDYIIPTLKEIMAINPTVRLMGSPWSPPVWMKTSGDISTGSLKSDAYDTYANYFVKFIQAYAAHGLLIDAITPQNEPGHEGGGYGGCSMSVAEQIKLVKKLGAAFHDHNLSTKIVIWDYNWSTWSALEILKDPAAKSYIAGSAFHHYYGDISAQTIVHEAHPDKGIYFTEGSDSVKRDNGFNSDLIRNGLFVIDALRNWAKTVIKWNLALDENNGPKIAGGCNTCYGVITINQSTRQITPRPQYYPLGHVSKFFRPGAVRIESGSGNVRTAAFKNTDGSVVLFAVNPNSFSQPVSLEWNGQKAVRSIPGSSMMTFRWDAVPNAKVDVYLTTGDQTSLLERCRPVYFRD